jgi:hypothetical protein
VEVLSVAKEGGEIHSEILTAVIHAQSERRSESACAGNKMVIDVDARDWSNRTAILDAVIDDAADVPTPGGNADTVNLLATMGADLGLVYGQSFNIFEAVEDVSVPAAKVALYEVLAEHGVTSSDIPSRFQSPLYFKSEYYQANLREQRWIVRRAFMMCLNRVFNWSLANQIESERLMTLPTDLSSIGLLVARCCMHVVASSVSNGIARLIMQFAKGFNRRLVGMPREEKTTKTMMLLKLDQNEFY